MQPNAVIKFFIASVPESELLCIKNLDAFVMKADIHILAMSPGFIQNIASGPAYIQNIASVPAYSLWNSVVLPLQFEFLEQNVF